MRVTVIIADSMVYLDGEARRVVLPPHDANWHALQWDGTRGQVEQIVGGAYAFRSFAVVAPFVEAWAANAPPPPPAPAGLMGSPPA
jgi:hypothetical protein